MATPSMEDYIEIIYKIISEKSYARVSDIAEELSVLPSSVTKMVQKLDQDGYLIYERYRGLSLTKKGKITGQRLLQRHQLLEDFLRMIGVEEENIHQDVEGIEHHLSSQTLTCIDELMIFLKAQNYKK